jgi:hypothetical protein
VTDGPRYYDLEQILHDEGEPVEPEPKRSRAEILEELRAERRKSVEDRVNAGCRPRRFKNRYGL